MYSSTLSLTSALDGGWWSTPRTGSFTHREEIRYPMYRRLGGDQTDLDGCGKSRLYQYNKFVMMVAVEIMIIMMVMMMIMMISEEIM